MRSLPSLFAALAALASLMLSGCGFQPLYARDTGVAAALSGIEVETGEGRSDYLLGVALRDRFGAWDNEPIYLLQARATTNRVGAALTIDQVASRIMLSVTVNYALYDRRTGRRLTQSRVNGQATFDVPREPYAAIRAEQDASQRAVESAADQLTIALARYMNSRQQAARAASAS